MEASGAGRCRKEGDVKEMERWTGKVIYQQRQKVCQGKGEVDGEGNISTETEGVSRKWRGGWGR